jgi:hypothetical protein
MVEEILNRHKEIVTEFALIGLGSPARSTRARSSCAWRRAKSAA